MDGVNADPGQPNTGAGGGGAGGTGAAAAGGSGVVIVRYELVTEPEAVEAEITSTLPALESASAADVSIAVDVQRTDVDEASVAFSPIHTAIRHVVEHRRPPATDAHADYDPATNPQTVASVQDGDQVRVGAVLEDDPEGFRATAVLISDHEAEIDWHDPPAGTTQIDVDRRHPLWGEETVGLDVQTKPWYDTSFDALNGSEYRVRAWTPEGPVETEWVAADWADARLAALDLVVWWSDWHDVPAWDQGVAAEIVSTLPALTQQASADVTVEAEAASTLPALTQAAEAQATVQAAATSTLPALTQQAEGEATVTAEAASTLPALTQAAQAHVDTPGAVIASTLPALTQQATGVVTVEAEAASTLPELVTSVAVHVDSGPVPTDLTAIPLAPVVHRPVALAPHVAASAALAPVVQAGPTPLPPVTPPKPHREPVAPKPHRKPVAPKPQREPVVPRRPQRQPVTF